MENEDFRNMEYRLKDENFKLTLENFNIETDLLEEKMKRESVELSQFSLETQLIEKGVI